MTRATLKKIKDAEGNGGAPGTPAKSSTKKRKANGDDDETPASKKKGGKGGKKAAPPADGTISLGVFTSVCSYSDSFHRW